MKNATKSNAVINTLALYVTGLAWSLHIQLKQHPTSQSQLWYLTRGKKANKLNSVSAQSLRVERVQFNPLFFYLLEIYYRPIRMLRGEGLRYFRSDLEVNC